MRSSSPGWSFAAGPRGSLRRTANSRCRDRTHSPAIPSTWAVSLIGAGAAVAGGRLWIGLLFLAFFIWAYRGPMAREGRQAGGALRRRLQALPQCRSRLPATGDAVPSTGGNRPRPDPLLPCPLRAATANGKRRWEGRPRWGCWRSRRPASSGSRHPLIGNGPTGPWLQPPPVRGRSTPYSRTPSPPPPPGAASVPPGHCPSP